MVFPYICPVTKTSLKDYQKTNNGVNIYLGDDRSHRFKGYANISVTLPNGSVKQIQNAMHVPSIKKNFMSVSTITDEELKVEFVKFGFFIKDEHDHYKVIATGVRVGGLYKLDVTMKGHQALASIAMSTEFLCHQRYGHLNYNDLLLL